MPLKIYFDGGCRPNPGAIETAVVARGTLHLRRDHGPGTSLDAEWLALIEALKLARGLGVADFILLGDALAVIAPASGQLPARGPAAAHLAAFLALADGPVRLRHVGRAQNLAGIALARLHPR